MAKRKKKTIKKYEKNLLMLLILLSVCVFGLMVALVISSNDKNSVSDNTEAITSLIKGDPGVAGRSCGILSELEAKDLLPTHNLTGRFTNEPVKNTVAIEDQDAGIHWADSCRYVDPNNSNIYIEMFIDTYEVEEEASADLNESLPKAGMVENVANDDYDELFYSSGAWFARQGKVVIKISANDGRSGDLKEYSKNVFTRLMLQM